MRKIKKCSKCNLHKLLNRFTNDKSRPDGLDYWCRSCKNKLGRKYAKSARGKVLARIRAKRWMKNNPERHKNNVLKRVYGITLEEQKNLFKAQNKCCAICKTKVPSYPGWVTDHCHAQNKVRGILCNRCNLLLGRAKDNVEILFSAARYLKKHI